MLGFRTGIFGLMGAAAAVPGWSHTITTVDSGGVGQYTSVVYGTDGLALISYYDQTNGDLEVAHCNDVACTTSTRNTLDSAGDVGRFTSIAIGPNGLGIVSYLDVTNGRLKVARCADAACTSASIAALPGAGPATDGTDIAVPPDTRPVIAFGSGGTLKLARCVDAACSDATALTVSADFGQNPSVAIGGDSLPLVAGDSGSLGDLRIAHCNDAACTTTTFVTINGGTSDGSSAFVYYSDATLATTPSGLGVVAYIRAFVQFGVSTFSISYRHCIDAACSDLTVGNQVLIGTGLLANGPEPALAVRGDGRPLLAGARFNDGGRLRVGNCHEPTCFGVKGQDVDGPGAGRFSSVAFSPAGIGLVAYHSTDTGGQLKTAYLDGPPEVVDVALTLLGPAGAVGPGQLLLYRPQILIVGPGTARYVTVTHTLPPELSFYAASASGCSSSTPATVTCPMGDIEGGSTSNGFLARVESVATGSITVSATASTVSVDPNPSNNTDTHTNLALPALSVRALPVVEGDSGLVEGRFDIELVAGDATPAPITAFYSTTGGSAMPGVDYLPVSGSLTFSPGGPVQSVAVSVVGDRTTELDESFFLGIGSASTVTYDSGLTIVDDDPWGAARAALAHGVTIRGDLAGSAPLGPEDLLAVEVPAYASFEILVDEVSGDVQPLSVELLNTVGFPTNVAFASPLGGSFRMAIQTQDTPQLNHTLRVRSGGCTTCGADDTYRLRGYETTARIARFNNAGSQATVLILQNTTDELDGATVQYWSPQGQLLTYRDFSLQPHGMAVIDTSQHVPGLFGSITIRHWFPYGALQGKAVSLEPATGFSFDTPLEYRPR